MEDDIYPRVVSVKSFLSVWKAIEFLERHPSSGDLFIHMELDGRYHVYRGE